MLINRPDGRHLKNVDPMQRIMPYIMKTRNDSMNLFEEQLFCDVWDDYIQVQKEKEISIGYMDILVAAVVRVIALRPQLNRFVMHGKLYARPKIWVSMVVHPSLKIEDGGTTIKVGFDGTENIFEVSAKLNQAIKNETVARQGDNGTDNLAKVIMSMPSWLIRIVVNFLMFLDRHCMLPKSVMELSPFHTSFFVTNLKSLGINHVFHHVYNFGTTGLFIAMGKEKYLPIAKDKESFEIRKCMGLGVVTDERYCDGLYFARSLRLMKKYFKNPRLLEENLAAKIEDVD